MGPTGRTWEGRAGRITEHSRPTKGDLDLAEDWSNGKESGRVEMGIVWRLFLEEEETRMVRRSKRLEAWRLRMARLRTFTFPSHQTTGMFSCKQQNIT